MTWQEELRDSVKTADELIALGYADEADKAQLESICASFPLAIPRSYLELIDKTDENDPIKKMCVPSVYEADMSGTFDTSGEADNTVVKGLQHKYSRTVLMLSTNVCAMYCRHCFRKRLVGTTEDETMRLVSDVTSYIREHSEIDNVLVSGGDSFLNSNRIIEKLLSELCDIPHIRFIRFGTRVPVVLPSRIYSDAELISILKKYSEKKTIYVVTQFNHPHEFSAGAISAIKKLKECGIVISNQTVLLNGVNADVDTLCALMNGLTDVGVLPYYLFQCRPVAAVKAQFQVPFVTAIDIVEQAKGKLNGHAKRFKYAMSHPTGKIEIIGKVGENKMIFKYHQPKYTSDVGRLFSVDVTPDQCWLDGIDRL